jgi:hypothetical protein
MSTIIGNDFGLLQRLQPLAWLEAHHLSRRQGNCCASTRVPANAEFAWAHTEDPKSPELDTLAFTQCPLHAFKDSFYGGHGLSLGDTSSVD